MSAKVFRAGWNFALEKEHEKIPIFQRLPQFEYLDVHSIIASREIVLILTSRGEVYQFGLQFGENSDDKNSTTSTTSYDDNPEFVFNTPQRLKTAEKIKKVFGSTLGLMLLSVTNRLYISSTRLSTMPTIANHVQFFDGVPSAISKMTATASTAHVILEDGSVYGAGSSNYGELGEVVIAADFIKLNFPKPIQKIKSGYNHNVYLAKDGAVYVSGFNTFFQLGLKNQVDVKQLLEHPYFASNNIKIKDVQTGASHCLFVAENDVIYASGYNGTKFVTNLIIYFSEFT